MRTFQYKTWGGRTRTVEGAFSVSFEHTHVVFKDSNRRIIVAERSENVNELIEVEAVGQATARPKEE